MRKQWTILLLGIALFGLSELFPPWVYKDEDTSVRRSAGYHFFNSPPKLKSPAEMRVVFSLHPNDPTTFIGVHQNGLRLYVQRILLIVLTPGIMLSLSNRGSAAKLVLASLFLIVGIGFSGLYVLDVWAMW
jgi:hypothetical protein